MPYHICTNCTRPTATLYKVYSTPGSIQLTTCQKCGRDVDPYIEREWLLVIMDCVLHRPEAFRHVLYNREPLCEFDLGKEVPAKVKESSDKEQKNESCKVLSSSGCVWYHNSSLKRLIRYSSLASLLRTYIWYMAKGADREDDDLISELIIVLIQSIMGEMSMLLTTILSGSFLVKQAYASQTKKDDASKSKNTSAKDLETDSSSNSRAFFYSRLHLALTIPVFFHIATVIALVWENSSTVSMLGTLFVLSLQYMGVAIVMQEQMGRVNYSLGKDVLIDDSQVAKEERALWMFLPHSFPFIAGLVARTICVQFTARILALAIPIDGDSLACTGIFIPKSDLFTTGSICIL